MCHYTEPSGAGDVIDKSAPMKARIGAVMGTFIIVSALSAPFVWYDRASNVRAPEISQIGSRRIERSVIITPRLAVAHSLVTVLACSIYRKVLLEDILPFLYGLLPGSASAAVSHVLLFPVEEQRSLVFGVEMFVRCCYSTSFGIFLVRFNACCRLVRFGTSS